MSGAPCSGLSHRSNTWTFRYGAPAARRMGSEDNYKEEVGVNTCVVQLVRRRMVSRIQFSKHAAALVSVTCLFLALSGAEAVRPIRSLQQTKEGAAFSLAEPELSFQSLMDSIGSMFSPLENQMPLIELPQPNSIMPSLSPAEEEQAVAEDSVINPLPTFLSTLPAALLPQSITQPSREDLLQIVSGVETVLTTVSEQVTPVMEEVSDVVESSFSIENFESAVDAINQVVDDTTEALGQAGFAMDSEPEVSLPFFPSPGAEPDEKIEISAGTTSWFGPTGAESSSGIDVDTPVADVSMGGTVEAIEDLIESASGIDVGVLGVDVQAGQSMSVSEEGAELELGATTFIPSISAVVADVADGIDNLGFALMESVEPTFPDIDVPFPFNPSPMPAIGDLSVPRPDPSLLALEEPAPTQPSIDDLFNGAVDVLEDALQPVTDVVEGVLNGVTELLVAPLEEAASSIEDGFVFVGSEAVEGVTGAGLAVGSTLTEAAAPVTDAVDEGLWILTEPATALTSPGRDGAAELVSNFFPTTGPSSSWSPSRSRPTWAQPTPWSAPDFTMPFSDIAEEMTGAVADTADALIDDPISSLSPLAAIMAEGMENFVERLRLILDPNQEVIDVQEIMLMPMNPLSEMLRAMADFVDYGSWFQSPVDEVVGIPFPISTELSEVAETIDEGITGAGIAIGIVGEELASNAQEVTNALETLTSETVSDNAENLSQAVFTGADVTFGEIIDAPSPEEQLVEFSSVMEQMAPLVAQFTAELRDLLLDNDYQLDTEVVSVEEIMNSLTGGN